MLGYMLFEGLDPVDAFLNAAMLMAGMEPVNTQYTDGGKIFAGFYAMYCGFVLIFSVAIFMTPVFHRVLHHFHLEGEKSEGRNNCIRFKKIKKIVNDSNRLLR
jgi:hypothetical protein